LEEEENSFRGYPGHQQEAAAVTASIMSDQK